MVTSAVPAKLILFQNNTQVVQLFGLRDTSGNFLNAGTLQATLHDQSGNNVPGLVNITLTNVASSNGDYTGTVGAAFSPSVGTEYTMVIDGDASGAHIHLELPAEVRVRTR
jgi:hypothetical protein